MSFNYFLSVTGDCQSTNTGIATLYLSGGVTPYTVEWISPSLPTDINVFSSITKTNLSTGVYNVRVNDSTLPVNQNLYINIPISSGVCASILGVQDTTCALNNGSVTGSSSSVYSSNSYFLYHSDGTFSQSATTSQANVVFGNLTAGTYYMTVLDLGGCTGQSQSFIIDESTPLSFGLYSVPNTSCGGIPMGKITVTGITGHAPYQYLWSNAQTGSTITGLTSGQYSVQVTDAYGCVLTQTATVNSLQPLGFGTFSVTQPTCFSSNGVVTLTVTGGTAPFYYSASTGNVLISYNTSYTLSGLSSGNINFQVTDAAFCKFVAGTTLVTPQGISSVNINSLNSTCSSNNGQITVTVNGGSIPFVYTLIYPNGDTLNISSNQTTQLFSNLTSGTYGVAVQDSTGCSYFQEVTIIAENKFTISTNAVSTSCNQRNGQIQITTTTGYTLPLDYSVDGLYNIIDTNLTATTFNNISGGTHVVTVTDADGCTQTSNVYVPYSQPLDFSLYSTSCGDGGSGTITAFITSGNPPFNFNWSDNVPNEPQQIQVSGLTAGTYSLTVVDSNSCSLTRTTSINCNTNYVSYQTYVMGAEVFNIKSPTKYGLLQMLNEGFYDLTTGNTSCDLINATFTAKVSVSPLGLSTSQTFFTSTSLVSAPTDNQYYNTVKDLLLSIPGVGNVTIDQLNNQITIETSRSNTSLQGQEIIIDLVIVYDIMCLK
jgi:large repetitive protein